MYRTVTFYDVTFQILPLAIAIQCRGPTTPPAPYDVCGLGCSPFARHYWGNHYLFSLPAGTKMFQFPAFASLLGKDDWPSARRVVPFGNHRVKGYLLLTGAYRSLSRPSSPPRAKASAMRPCLLSFKRFILVLVLVVELLPSINIAYSNTYGLIYTFSSY